MKHTVRAVVFFIAAVLFLPLFFLCYGLAQEPCYTQTYYGELPLMAENLRNTQGQKIVLIGNSAVAFGVNSALMEQQLRADGLDYSVCNFGLYGLIGTKAMLDLALPELSAGDIAIVIPEQSGHAMSLWFSGREMWKAIDGNYSMVFRLAEENRPQMLGSFVSHVAEKYKYEKQGILPEPTGVYARRSFDENCDMIYPREQNILLNGVDQNDSVSFDSSLLQDDFITYLNEYAAKAERRGAQVCFAWCPINRMSLTPGTDEGAIAAYYDLLDEKLDMPILSDPNNYLLDREWFYDSNFHMNTAGSTLYTYLLTDDIKSFLGDLAPTAIELPEKPAMPEIPQAPEPSTAGDNSCEELFLYEKNSGGWTITGITEAGKATRTLVVPVSHSGSTVTDFAADVFQNDTVLETLVIQSNIRILYNSSFAGCTALKTIELRQPTVSAISVGLDLLEGTGGVTILVPQESIADYLNDYFWGHYAGYYETF